MAGSQDSELTCICFCWQTVKHCYHISLLFPIAVTTFSSPKSKRQKKYRSVISDVFDGTIVSSVQCLTCDRVSRCTFAVFLKIVFALLRPTTRGTHQRLSVISNFIVMKIEQENLLWSLGLILLQMVVSFHICAVTRRTFCCLTQTS